MNGHLAKRIRRHAESLVAANDPAQYRRHSQSGEIRVLGTRCVYQAVKREAKRTRGRVEDVTLDDLGFARGTGPDWSIGKLARHVWPEKKNRDAGARAESGATLRSEKRGGVESPGPASSQEATP